MIHVWQIRQSMASRLQFASMSMTARYPMNVVDTTIDWIQAKYESIFEDDSGAMKVHRGKIHKYLGMSLNFSVKGQ